jgi:hypothetical protein
MHIRKISFPLGLALTIGILFVLIVRPDSISNHLSSGDWDVLSLMMMDPTLAPAIIWKATTLQTAARDHTFTTWSQSDNKVWYKKSARQSLGH